MTDELRDQFLAECLRIDTEASQALPRYSPWFRDQLSDPDTAILATTKLIFSTSPASAFRKAADANRLDLSVESLVVDQFSDLFPDDVVDAAKWRLANPRAV